MSDDAFIILMMFVVLFVGFITGIAIGAGSQECPSPEVPSLVLNLPKEADEPVQDLVNPDGFKCKIINNEVYVTVVCDFEPVGP